MYTNNLSLLYLLQNQASADVVINESLQKIDALAFNIAKDIGNLLPESAQIGDVYICLNVVDNQNKVAVYLQNKGWCFISPKNGMTFFVISKNKEYRFLDSTWSEVKTGLDFQNFSIDDDTQNLRVNVNKKTTSDTASYIFKRNWNGMAEFGLIGDDNFALKVSHDGQNFKESFKVENQTGDVDFKQNIMKSGVNVATVNDLIPFVKKTELPTNIVTSSDLTPYVKQVDLPVQKIPSGRNYIINGNFDIWQRGAILSANKFQYFADRWYGGRQNNMGTLNVARVSNSMARSQYMMRAGRMLGDVDVSAIGICQFVDNNTVKLFAGEKITVSAKVRLGNGFNGLENVVKMRVFSSVNNNQSGNAFGFSLNSVMLGEIKTDVQKGVWFDLSLTVNVLSSVQSLMVSFVTENQNGVAVENDFFEVSQVKLELGDTKTEFLPNDFNAELLTCKYFYERLSPTTAMAPTGSIGFADGTNIVRAPLIYATKRTVPKISISTQTALNVLRWGTDTQSSAVAFTTITPFSARIDVTTAGAVVGGEALILNFVNNQQFIEIDAEIS